MVLGRPFFITKKAPEMRLGFFNVLLEILEVAHHRVDLKLIRYFTQMAISTSILLSVCNLKVKKTRFFNPKPCQNAVHSVWKGIPQPESLNLNIYQHRNLYKTEFDRYFTQMVILTSISPSAGNIKVKKTRCLRPRTGQSAANSVRKRALRASQEGP